MAARSSLYLAFALANFAGLFMIWVGPEQSTKITISILVLFNLAILSKAAASCEALLLPLLFAIVFSLFHFSLLPIDILDQQFLSLNPYFSQWYFEPFTVLAFEVCLTFFLGFVGGVLGSMKKNRAIGHGESSAVAPEYRSDVLLLLFFVMIIYFFTAVFIILGVSNYTEYNETARVQNAGIVEISLIFLYPAIGTAAMLCAARTRSLRLFLGLFAVWAVPAFAVGLRGVVLFPAALVVPLLLRRLHVRFRLLPAMAGSLAMLWCISFGRIVRSEGDWAGAMSGASPVDGMAELGGSLRPVYEVVRWTENGIFDHIYGATYWAPIERTFQNLMPFIDPIPAMLDDRLMNVTIVKLAGGAYGFSIAAEAYVNFGIVGAAVLGILSGMALSRIGERFAVARVTMWSAALAYALFYHIRQSYVGAWGSFIVVAVFAAVLIKIDDAARRRRAGAA